MHQKNQQQPTPPVYDQRTLVVHSIFPTIQGEGPFAGRRAVFVRLAHCNLQCPGCDTEYTEGARVMEIPDIIGRVQEVGFDYELVVITGGEPFRQDIRQLVAKLHEHYGKHTQVETNGTLYPYELPMATIVVSPKTHRVHPDLAQRANAYKYVVKYGDVDTDGLPIHALDHPLGKGKRLARPPANFTGPVYIQPMDEGDQGRGLMNTRTAVRSAMQHGYTLCLQVHKIVGVE